VCWIVNSCGITPVFETRFKISWILVLFASPAKDPLALKISLLLRKVDLILRSLSQRKFKHARRASRRRNVFARGRIYASRVVERVVISNTGNNFMAYN
jgi:hypothetical protein